MCVCAVFVPPGYLPQVDAVCGDDKPSIEQLRALKFTTRVVNESMRLYPQPPVLIRRYDGVRQDQGP